MDLEGRRGWVLAEDAEAVADAPQARGARLLPNLDPLGRLGKRARDAIAAEADRLAPYRGAETAELAWAKNVRSGT